MEWVDAASYTEEWHYDKELDDDIAATMVQSTGFLVRENDLFYVLAGTITYSVDKDDYMYCCIIEIPKTCVKTLKELDGSVEV